MALERPPVRYVWVDTGNDPDFAKAVKHGIDGFYFDMFDPRVTEGYLKPLVADGYRVGVYMASNWGQFGYGFLSGKDIAEVVVKRVREIQGKSAAPSFPKVQIDMEEHDPALISEVILELRRLLPKKDFSWTMEGFQGGWMDPAFVKTVVDSRFRVVPQAYYGDMTDTAEDMVLRDLLKRGFPESSVSLFYDAASLPAGWNGFAFTQGRLP